MLSLRSSKVFRYIFDAIVILGMMRIDIFVEDGYTCYDDYYPELVKPTKDGFDFLHCKIEDISKKYINFMERNSLECSKNIVAEWFVKEFMLDDFETGEEYLTLEIATNLCECSTNGSRQSVMKFHDATDNSYNNTAGWGEVLLKN